MSFVVDISKLTLPATIDYVASPQARQDMAKRFEFDAIQSFVGQFRIEQQNDYYLLQGSYNADIQVQAESISAKEDVALFLLTSKTQEALFDMTDDIEILMDEEFDLEEILAQYLYLNVTDPE